MGAARLVVEQGYSQAEAARRLGVTATSIKSWIEQFRKSGQLPPEGQSTPQADELKRLREECRQLQLENDILKKLRQAKSGRGGCVL